MIEHTSEYAFQQNLAAFLQRATPGTLAELVGALSAELTARGITGSLDLCRVQARLEAAEASRRARLAELRGIEMIARCGQGQSGGTADLWEA